MIVRKEKFSTTISCPACRKNAICVVVEVVGSDLGGDVSSTWIQWNADVAIIANDLRVTPAIFTEAPLKPNGKRFEVAALLTAVPKGYPVFSARWA